jgi:hypothetical protein
VIVIARLRHPSAPDGNDNDGVPHDHPNQAWHDPRNQKRRILKPDAHLRHTGLPFDSGNKGANALRRIEGDAAHFLMITFWESEEAIHAFAGDDISVAKYYDFRQEFPNRAGAMLRTL